MTEDERFLDILAIFHYVIGGITALFACFPLLYVAVGLMLIADGVNEHGPAAWFPWLFVIFGWVLVITGWSLAAAILIAGRKLEKRKAWMYCVVVAGVECVLIPLGTALGVFTLILLTRESVKRLFGAGGGSSPGEAPPIPH